MHTHLIRGIFWRCTVRSNLPCNQLSHQTHSYLSGISEISLLQAILLTVCVRAHVCACTEFDSFHNGPGAPVWRNCVWKNTVIFVVVIDSSLVCTAIIAMKLFHLCSCFTSFQSPFAPHPVLTALVGWALNTNLLLLHLLVSLMWLNVHQKTVSYVVNCASKNSGLYG